MPSPSQEVLAAYVPVILSPENRDGAIERFSLQMGVGFQDGDIRPESGQEELEELGLA